jgi:hypothetical protein
LSLAAAMLIGRGRVLTRAHRLFWLISAAASLVVAMTLTVPALMAIMRFASPSAGQLLISVAIGTVSGGWYATRLIVAPIMRKWRLRESAYRFQRRAV